MSELQAARDRAETVAAQTFQGGGELGERIRALDWSSTPLGPIEGWPQSLKTAVRIMLGSRQPIWLGWGEQLTKLYNDPYKAIVGGKHPAALGQPAAVVWREIWDEIGPMLTTAMGGVEGTYVEAQLLIMERNGYPEETYYTFSYSPIHDDDGAVGGIICANTDDTRRVIGERELLLLRDLAARTADARTLADACALSAASLATNPRDLPFALIYLTGADPQLATLAGAAPAAEIANPEAWPLAEVLASNQARLVTDLGALAGALPTGAWDRPPHQAVALPIAGQGGQGQAGVLVVGLSPYRLFDDHYRGFLDLVTAQLATTIANAQAYEQERMRAEALAELDRAKTAFFSNVSHEFRTPLTLMLGPLEDLLGQPAGALAPAQREPLEIAHRNALRLLRLVNMLLDFSRIEAGRIQASYQPTDLATLTAELASVFRSTVERAGLRLVVSCPPLPAPAYVDREMWEKIVFNLLSNAFKYTLAGEIGVELRQAGDHAELVVRDTGTGIPADELPRLFERFYRVKDARGRTFEGTGIGLALVQELAKLHGGSVRAESQVDRGSTFTVAIPLGAAHLPAQRIGATPELASTSVGSAAYTEAAERWLPTQSVEFSVLSSELAISETQHSTLNTQNSPRIVLADDNADMREYVRRLLGGEYDVLAVPDGAAALRAARERRPDLVLTDVMMPELDGFGLLRALRADERLRTVPVILLSARAGEEARVEGLAAGADDYLTKPFSARELQARVTARLELARLRAQLDSERTALARLFSQSPVPIAVLRGPELIYDLANPTYCQVVGRDVQGQPLLEALPELKGQGFDELLLGVMRTGEPVVEHEAPLKLERAGQLEDTYWTFIYAPLQNASGQIDSVVAICNEVTEQVRARHKLEQLTEQLTEQLGARAQIEERLRLNEERLRLTLTAADIGTWDLRPESGELTWDARCKELFGLPPEIDVSYDTFLSGLHPEDRASVDQAVVRALDQASGGRFHVEYRTIGIADGAERWVSANGQTFFDGAGRAVRFIGTVLEITERKRAEAEREQQLEQERSLRSLAEEASRLKDEFLATISHELRTPLTAFLGYTQILQRRTHDQAYVARTVEKLLRSARDQAQLIEDLLDISRFVSGKLRIEPQPLDLGPLIFAALDTVRPAIEAKAHRLRIDLPEAPCVVVGDAGRLQQVVWNLLSNAAKFTPAGGEIRVRLVEQASEALLTVEDTGQGISPAFLPYVFDRFRQADGASNRAHGGLGLGLAIARHLIELHGGVVEAASPGEGRGATFTVRLPLAAATGAEAAQGLQGDQGAPAEADACAPELTGLRVVVVDDQPDILELVHEILRSCGAVVCTCTSARAALDLVRGWRPDVLVSDIAMPGDDGYWLIRQVRALPADQGGGIPAMALTAYVRIEDRLQVLAAGYQRYVPKPVEPAELLDVLAQLAQPEPAP